MCTSLLAQKFFAKDLLQAAHWKPQPQTNFTSIATLSVLLLCNKTPQNNCLTAGSVLQNKVADFLAIVNGSLISFMETYETSLPNQSAEESQFILSMCGIVTNIAATPAGRQFLATNTNGRDLLEQFNRILPVIPEPSGNYLKR
jgi:hypothetical protein